jgi:serine/threonine protein kinase
VSAISKYAYSRTCMQIINHICLVDLHQAGYVHRDLKPGNIMWLPSQSRWTLIDFGCVARINADAQTGFTLMYAAPEAVRAHFREHRLIQASAALEVWSVGVIAVELFSGRPPLAILEGREKVKLLSVTCYCAANLLQQMLMQEAKHCPATKWVQPLLLTPVASPFRCWLTFMRSFVIIICNYTPIVRIKRCVRLQSFLCGGDVLCR